MTATEIASALADPFDPSEIKFKPKKPKGCPDNRCLAMAYIDARLVQDRLDETVGIFGWSTSYQQIGQTSFECRLSVKIGDAWVTKADVGSTSDQEDEGDRVKAAYSDALKRAAVAFGVGRYLYRLPAAWCDYDPVKKRIAEPPALRTSPSRMLSPPLGSVSRPRPQSRSWLRNGRRRPTTFDSRCFQIRTAARPN